MAFVCFFTSTNSRAASIPLPGDQAFVFSVNNDQADQVYVNGVIAPGYYLYRDRMQITSSSHLIAETKFPQGELKYNQDRGRYEAYAMTVTIPVKLKTATTELPLSIQYQGCSQEGFCYPPMQKKYDL